MRQLRSVTLREQVLAALRAAIVTGDLKPGEIYSGPLLARRYGVSATPVREAMLELTRQGIVESVRNRGFRVRILDDADLDEIIELRILLEVASIGRVAKLFPADREPHFRSLTREIERAAAGGDLIKFLEADRRFHLELLELCGNQRLVALVGSLRDQTRLTGLRDLEAGTLIASGTEHTAILDAVVARDAGAARRLLRSHLAHTRGIWAGSRETNGVPVAVDEFDDM